LENFLARQPIFNCDRTVYGYELLFRSGPENYFHSAQPDFAAASTADNLLLFGLERLTEGRRAFLNCTREFLLREYPLLLPKDRVVIEILETVSLDDELLGACRRLKEAGYLIALDDYKDEPKWHALLSLADFIKVDVLATSADEQRRLAQLFAPTKVKLLAEKVETYEDFQRTRNWGYVYFQGYFFSKPQMLTRRAIPASKLSYFRVLQAVNQPQVDIHDVSEKIKTETSLSYRLLRYLNSPAFPLVAEVHSIPHALSLLGERGMRRWVSLVAVACLGDEKPAELLMLPLIRARFCELLAAPACLGESSNDLFLLGLLSAMDGLLDMKMADILEEITLGEKIRDALLGKENYLREVFEVVLTYEKGAWDMLAAAASLRKIPEEVIPGLFLQAVDWAKAVLSGHEAREVDAK
jgi:EAL and modified HD-GYP domain-containing signal transduction protein